MFGALLAILFTESRTVGVGPEGSRLCSGPGPPAWSLISCPSLCPLQTVQKPASAGITGQNYHQKKKSKSGCKAQIFHFAPVDALSSDASEGFLQAC